MMFKKLMMCSFAAIQLFFVEPISATLMIDDDFYVGKIPGKEFRGGKELWLVMERINENNHWDWLDYLSSQRKDANPRVPDPQLIKLTDGSGHAQCVLKGGEDY